MELMQEFKEKVLSDVTQFEIQIRKKKLYFVKYTVGKAAYILGDYNYGEFSLDTKLSIKAILSEGTIYVVDTFLLPPLENEEYPKNVFSFSKKIEELNGIVENELFPEFYNNLPIRELTEEERGRVINQVRETVLKNNNVITSPIIKKLLNKENVTRLLCGSITIEEITNEYFNEYKEGFIRMKSENHELKKLVDLKYGLENWEIEMAEALRELKALNVTVEFNFNGLHVAEKVEKNGLLRMLCDNDYFSSYNFTTYKSGEELLKKLNAGSWRHHENDTLECKHIASIKYGKKIIYSSDIKNSGHLLA